MKQLRRRRRRNDFPEQVIPDPSVYNGRGGAIGRYLPYEIGSERTFPSDAEEQIQFILMNAMGFAKNKLRVHSDAAVEAGKHRLNALIPPEQKGPFAQVLRSLFWEVNSYHAERFENRPEKAFHLPSALGAKAQTALTRAYLGMSDAERYATSRCMPSEDKGLYRDWMRACSGAFAVARLARQLLVRNVPTVLPARKVDAFASIDLLGVIHRSRPVHLCFQVKRAEQYEPTSLVFLEDHRMEEQPLALQAIRQRMLRFSRYHNLHCIPMFLTIADDGSTTWDIRGGSILNETIDDLIAYVNAEFP